MAIAYLSGTAATVISSETAAVTSAAYNSGATGSDRCLVVALYYENDTAPQNCTAMTYAGVSMTRAVKSTLAGQFVESVELWTLANPATGSNTLALTLADSGQDLVAVAAVFTGVNQSTPAGNTAAANGSSPQSVSLSYSDNSMGVYAIVSNRADGGPYTPVDGNSIELLDSVIASGASGFNYTLGYRGPEASAGSYTLGANSNAFLLNASSAVELKIATGGGGGVIDPLSPSIPGSANDPLRGL